MPVTTISSSGNWTSPAATGTATVQCTGGGGGGESGMAAGGGGGGGGAFAQDDFVYAASTAYACVIPNAAAAGADGGDVTFNATTVVAKGGVKGASGTGGAGGLASGSTGTVKRDGGTGGNGHAGGKGGGGGSSAGTAAAGNVGGNADGSNPGTGGAAPTGGGAGGDGANAGATGTAGSAPGGAGGGSGALGTGGAGAKGQVVISYPSAVSTATGPVDGNYVTGQNLDVVVTWLDNITVTGSPYVALTIGAQTRNADYLSGSGGTALTFRYQVQADDLDTDGISCATSVTLNSGTLADSDGVAASLTFTAPTLTGVYVNLATAGAIGSVGKFRRVGGPAGPTRRPGRRI